MDSVVAGNRDNVGLFAEPLNIFLKLGWSVPSVALYGAKKTIALCPIRSKLCQIVNCCSEKPPVNMALNRNDKLS